MTIIQEKKLKAYIQTHLRFLAAAIKSSASSRASKLNKSDNEQIDKALEDILSLVKAGMQEASFEDMIDAQRATNKLIAVELDRLRHAAMKESRQKIEDLKSPYQLLLEEADMSRLLNYPISDTQLFLTIPELLEKWGDRWLFTQEVVKYGLRVTLRYITPDGVWYSESRMFAKEESRLKGCEVYFTQKLTDLHDKILGRCKTKSEPKVERRGLCNTCTHKGQLGYVCEGTVNPNKTIRACGDYSTTAASKPEKTGKTTRLVNEAVEALFRNGFVLFLDHCQMDQDIAFQRLLNRLYSTHHLSVSNGDVIIDRKLNTVFLKGYHENMYKKPKKEPLCKSCWYHMKTCGDANLDVNICTKYRQKESICNTCTRYLQPGWSCTGKRNHSHNVTACGDHNERERYDYWRQHMRRQMSWNVHYPRQVEIAKRRFERYLCGCDPYNDKMSCGSALHSPDLMEELLKYPPRPYTTKDLIDDLITDISKISALENEELAELESLNWRVSGHLSKKDTKRLKELRERLRNR